MPVERHIPALRPNELPSPEHNNRAFEQVTQLAQEVNAKTRENPDGPPARNVRQLIAVKFGDSRGASATGRYDGKMYHPFYRPNNQPDANPLSETELGVEASGYDCIIWNPAEIEDATDDVTIGMFVGYDPATKRPIILVAPTEGQGQYQEQHRKMVAQNAKGWEFPELHGVLEDPA